MTIKGELMNAVAGPCETVIGNTIVSFKKL